MHRLKVLSGDAVIKILESFSFAVIGQKGSHIKLRRTKSKIHQTLLKILYLVVMTQN